MTHPLVISFTFGTYCWFYRQLAAGCIPKSLFCLQYESLWLAHHKTISKTLYTPSNRILHLQNIIIEVLSFSSPTQFIESSTAGQGYDIGCDANANIMGTHWELAEYVENTFRIWYEQSENFVGTYWEHYNPTPPPPQRKIIEPLGCILHHLIGWVVFKSLTVLITHFHLD